MFRQCITITCLHSPLHRFNFTRHTQYENERYLVGSIHNCMLVHTDVYKFSCIAQREHGAWPRVTWTVERVDFNEIYMPLCIQKSSVPLSRFRLHFNELQRPLLSQLKRNWRCAPGSGTWPIDWLGVFLPPLIWSVIAKQLSCRLVSFLYMNYLLFSFSSVSFHQFPRWLCYCTTSFSLTFCFCLMNKCILVLKVFKLPYLFYSTKYLYKCSYSIQFRLQNRRALFVTLISRWQ